MRSLNTGNYLRAFLSVLLLWLGSQTMAAADPGAAPLRVASKTFTESYLLAELAVQLLEASDLSVEREPGLGGSMITFSALTRGEIDLYPDYTGTLAQALLDDPGLGRAALEKALAARGLRIVTDLGFDNSYALAMPEALAAELGISTISDLAEHPGLEAIFSHEFLQRDDGWGQLSQRYGLRQKAVGIEHALAYDALQSGQAQITEAYTTDGELVGRNLRLLQDDRGFFPGYRAVLVARDTLPADAIAALAPLQGLLDERTVRRLNRAIAIGGRAPAAVAHEFLLEAGLVSADAAVRRSTLSRVGGYVLTHLKLTITALLLACAVAIPAALLLSRYETVARLLLYFTGLLQTIPSLALLALLIPLVGLGELPAIIALFLYSLLPIVRNTLTGIFGVDPLLKQVATGMGLSSAQRLRLIELPLAAPMILAGVKTAAIISIGTATLAAFVGAGGLGEPIITGLNLNSSRLILEGALPAAGLAVLTELLFEGVERRLLPAHLRN